MRNEKFRSLTEIAKNIHKEFSKTIFNSRKYGTNPTYRLGAYMLNLRDNEVLDEYKLQLNTDERRIHVSGKETISGKIFSFTFSTN